MVRLWAMLDQLDKLKNTRNGNPVFRAHLITQNGETLCYLTKRDSTFSYEITNHLNKGYREWILSKGIIIGCNKPKVEE